MECQLQPMAESRHLEEATAVPEGHVEQVCREWLVREDGVLAYRLQTQEIEQHYDKNRFQNRLAREDLQQAKCLQEHEETEAEMVRRAYEKMLLDQEEEDARVAKEVQEQLLEEERQRQRLRELEDERLARQLQEKEKLRLERKKREKEQERENQEVERAHSELLAKGIIGPPAEDPTLSSPFEQSSTSGSPVLPPPILEQIDDDFTDFYLPPPPGISTEELSKYQEDQDARRGQTYRDRQLAIEAQDRELAKVLQEQERARAKRARERARQRALQQQQQKQLQHDMEKIEELGCPSSAAPGDDDTVSRTTCSSEKIWYRDSESMRFDDDGASTSGYTPESVPNIAVALDPTYHRRKASLECQSTSSSKPTSPLQSPIRSAEQSPDMSPFRNGIPNDYFDESILEEGGESPVPPYMPIQGTRRTSSLEKSKKPKKQKNGCKTQ